MNAAKLQAKQSSYRENLRWFWFFLWVFCREVLSWSRRSTELHQLAWCVGRVVVVVVVVCASVFARWGWRGGGGGRDRERERQAHRGGGRIMVTRVGGIGEHACVEGGGGGGGREGERERERERERQKGLQVCTNVGVKAKTCYTTDRDRGERAGER